MSADIVVRSPSKVRAADEPRHLVARTLSVEIYHGPTRARHFSAVQCADLVITTYGTVTSDAQKRRNVLSSVQWFRIILDEGE